MRSLLVTFTIAMLCAGCSLLSSPATDLLNQADAKLVAEDYSGAVALYTELINSYPNDAQIPRARATRTLLERLRGTETDLTRAQSDLARTKSDLARTQAEELPKARREVSDRQNEVDQLKSEMAKLRADLERLRNIDLQDIRPVPKK